MGSTSTRIDHYSAAGIATITLNGPDTRNALDRASAADLVAACDAIDADRDVGVAVLTGSHGSFCSGAVRGVLAGLGKAPAHVGYEELGAIYAAFDRVGNLGVPVLAVLDGPAVGAGVNLALAADLRVATPAAQLISGFARLGIHPGGGHLHLLSRTAGHHVAVAMGLFAQELDANRAMAHGLIWEVVAPSDLEETVNRMCAHLASDPALARALKASLRLTTSPPTEWAAAVEVERARQMWSLTRATPASDR